MALSRTKKLLIVGGATLLVAGIVAASLLTRRTDALSVQIEQVKRRELLEAKVSASGEVRPVALYNLTAEVAGRVTDIFVKEGDVVRKGQPLVKVESDGQGEYLRAIRPAIALSMSRSSFGGRPRRGVPICRRRVFPAESNQFF